jgi:hypothetical protein
MGVRWVAVAPRGCEAEGGLRVITCPDCHAENETGAEVCHACGRALSQVETANAPLPQWLQQLKPEEDALLEEPMPVSARAVAIGTDSVLASPKNKSSKRSKPEPEPKGGLPGGMTETASLISEDDLPAWLRAFGEVESQKQAAPADDSWMVGADAEGAANPTSSQNLAQSWQAPARPVEARARTGAASVFSKPGESATKPDRVITSAAPVATALEPEPELRPASGRMELPRPMPMPRERSGLPLQRVALVAFVAALIIFLVVLGIFVVPSFM